MSNSKTSESRRWNIKGQAEAFTDEQFAEWLLQNARRGQHVWLWADRGFPWWKLWQWPKHLYAKYLLWRATRLLNKAADLAVRS